MTLLEALKFIEEDTKMTPLKALETLQQFYSKDFKYYIDGKEFVDKPDKYFEIIKSALERLEKLEKVWEIAKNKKIDFITISKLETYEQYKHSPAPETIIGVDGIYHKEMMLTETEFNLLKEMCDERPNNI